MKKIFFLILLCIYIGNQAKGQYNSIYGENTTIWTIKHENLHGVTTDTLRLLSDTIVNDIVYKVIPTPLKHIYLHENLIEGRLSYFTNHDHTVKLLMDLSLNIGDSFFVEGAWMSEHGYFEVDSVYEKDQRKHVQLNLPLYYANNEKLTFIEGIGPNTGLSYQDSPSGELNPYLLCYWKDDQQEYANIHYDAKCSISSFMNVESEKQLSPSFNISPNPVTNSYFNVTFNEPFKGQMALMDIAGNIIFEKIITEGLLNGTIILPDLNPTGMYIFRIQTDKGAIRSKKIAIIQ